VQLYLYLRQIGSEAEKDMKLWIRDQRGKSAPGKFRWAPLTDATLKRKGKRNKTLIDSSSMLQSITSTVMFPNVFVGLKRGVKNKKGDDLVPIAAVHEFGSQARNIPARPFVRPILVLIEKKIANNLIGRRLLAFIRKKYSF